MATDKYRQHIEHLYRNGRYSHAAFQNLVSADDEAIPALLDALRHDPSDDIRECCAEVLRDRRCLQALPELVDALEDESWHVRFDVFHAIETICGIDHGALTDWLRVTYYSSPKTIKPRVEEWLRHNSKYLLNLAGDSQEKSAIRRLIARLNNSAGERK